MANLRLLTRMTLVAKTMRAILPVPASVRADPAPDYGSHDVRWRSDADLTPHA